MQNTNIFISKYVLIEQVTSTRNNEGLARDRGKSDKITGDTQKSQRACRCKTKTGTPQNAE